MTPQRILIIEDDPTLAALILHWLRGRHTVDHCSNGADGLERARSGDYDVVISDIQLPDLSGIEIAEAITASDRRPVMLLMTSDTDVQLAIRAIDQGVDGYLLKPIERAGLFAALERAVETRHRGREAKRAERKEQLAMLVHDLRNPLTALMMMLDSVDPSDEEDLAELVELGRKSTTAIREVLDHALPPEDPASRPPVALDEVVRASVDAFAAGAWAKGQHLNVGRLPNILVDDPHGQLRSVVDNLIANALKFTPRGGRVDVSLNTSGRFAQVAVRDDGQGLEPGEHLVLFERRRTGSARPTDGESSNGLGLYAVRTSVEGLGGHAWAASAGPGKGSTFAFQVPRILAHPSAVTELRRAS